jgi:pimeloyl-ACP methyl ester carboxylesterase
MTLSYLDRPEGRVAYELHGEHGPLVLCAPGMGDLRQTYRHLVPRLLGQGCRVAVLDLRGHGDSDATFTRYDNVALGTDLLALVDELGGPAVLVGSSMAAGAAVWAAAEAPERVAGIALLGPFVRDPEVGPVSRILLRLMLSKPWGPAAFLSYYRKLVPGTEPAGHAEHLALVRENLRRPGHWRAFAHTTRTSHAPAEARLGDVSAPAVVVMGEADVDWKDPAAEATWIGDRLGGEVVLLPGVGHYPQAQAPEETAGALTRLLARTTRA